METRRLIPAVESDQISNDDLIGLLRSAEECGRQHVFLYSCDKAHELLDEARVRDILARMGKADLLTNPAVLAEPATPTLADVRWEQLPTGRSLVVKEIELRSQQRYVRTERDGNLLRKVYEIKQERVVNIARLHANGLFEIRVGSHANSSRYQDDINRFWRQVELIFPNKEFLEVSLSEAKSRLLRDRADLTNRIRYSDSVLRNDNGVILRAATGTEGADLGADVGAQASISAFVEHDAYCEGHNFYFKAAPGLGNDVHVLMTGALNEFAIPANCSAGDYQYVLDQVRSLNRRVS